MRATTFTITTMLLSACTVGSENQPTPGPVDPSTVDPETFEPVAPTAVQQSVGNRPECADADWDGDNIVSIIDFSHFLGWYQGFMGCFGSASSEPGCDAYDFNANGAVDVLDFSTVLVAYNLLYECLGACVSGCGEPEPELSGTIDPALLECSPELGDWCTSYRRTDVAQVIGDNIGVDHLVYGDDGFVYVRSADRDEFARFPVHPSVGEATGMDHPAYRTPNQYSAMVARDGYIYSAERGGRDFPGRVAVIDINDSSALASVIDLAGEVAGVERIGSTLFVAIDINASTTTERSIELLAYDLAADPGSPPQIGRVVLPGAAIVNAISANDGQLHLLYVPDRADIHTAVATFELSAAGISLVRKVTISNSGSITLLESNEFAVAGDVAIIRDPYRLRVPGNAVALDPAAEDAAMALENEVDAITADGAVVVSYDYRPRARVIDLSNPNVDRHDVYFTRPIDQALLVENVLVTVTDSSSVSPASLDITVLGL